jgi:hypothetical protein
LHAMKHRHALKDATSRLLEAKEHLAMMREHVGFKKGVPGVKEERAARLALEEQEEAARGMAVLEAQQASQRRQKELELEAEIEQARIHAVSEAHLKVEMEQILSNHKKNSDAAELQLALDKERHKKLLQERLRRRRKTRQSEHEKHMEAVAIATPVDLAADLKYAEAQAQQLQESADSIMLHFVASQKAMAEELER